MTLLILFGVLALVAAGVVAVPLLFAVAALWLVTLPFRLAFRLLFGGVQLLLGLGAAILSILALPLVLLVAAIGLVGAVLAGVLSLAVPLVPLALLGLLAWAIYRVTAHRPDTVI